MAKQAASEPLTAREFFARGLDGCSMTDAHFATRIAYSTIIDIAHGKSTPRPNTAKALDAWSRDAGAPHGVHIDAALAVLDVAPRAATTVAA